MKRLILITGGARSGKSEFAEARTLELGRPASYIATAEAHDAEMAARIEAHKQRRGGDWKTHAEPLDLVGALTETDKMPRLVDCLTMWLSNLMLAGQDWGAELDGLVAALPEQTHPVVFVTNEVGQGIVPENALAREFRDAAGEVNQKVACAADEVCLVVAGCALQIK